MARSSGGPEVVTVEDVDEPELRPGTARVAVHSAAVNFPDLLVLAGKYQASVLPPYTPGCEFSGRVLEIADDVASVRPGDVVFGLATHGAFAERVVIDAGRLTPIPTAVDVDMRQLAAFGVTYTTAYHALHTFAEVRPGEHVTVLGASGGLGLAAVDIALALGARPIAVGGSPAKLAIALERGAVAAVDYTSDDVKSRLNALTDGGASVVIDPVGGPYAEQALRAMRWGGRYVVLGFAAGEIPRIPLNLVLLKGISVMGFENRTILDHLPDLAAAHRAEVLQLLLDGRVRPHIGSVYPLDDIVSALNQLAKRRAVGKVLVSVGDGDS
ncbi:NADPH:quinone oxidoreductase family protein [Mycolicibacter senuensis]|uniref:NADPH:quinone oxidoreductase family protein n=2 Tax=Mycobacteriaceae TaxID=1762 RepID=A0A7K3L6S9_9MYCO|nr:NADPH:quinone oxidoreductase family protein [Mycolicibacter kumamotonensis]NDJ88129.1 NADPH:quinone oxidoreductase family protein [Mycolicibacter kumamotonensis]RAV03860.1 NADPH:quinone oxidoreductase family protein [Mycolicibacter senuensis]